MLYGLEEQIQGGKGGWPRLATQGRIHLPPPRVAPVRGAWRPSAQLPAQAVLKTGPLITAGELGTPAPCQTVHHREQGTESTSSGS